MNKMILLSSVLLITTQLEAAQQMLFATTQTTFSDDEEFGIEQAAYRTARTSPAAQPSTVSRGTQTNVEPSAPAQELLNPTGPHYLDEETQTNKKADDEKALALLNDAAQNNQYTFGVHDKVVAAIAAVLGLWYIKNRPSLANALLTEETFALTALASAATAKMLSEKRNGYFWQDYVPTGILSGTAFLTTLLIQQKPASWRPYRIDAAIFGIGAVVGTTIYNGLQWWKTPSTPAIDYDNKRAIKN